MCDCSDSITNGAAPVTSTGGGGSSQWTTIGYVTPNPIYYSNSVGIGSTAVPTATLMVTGNIYASNAVQTPSLFVTTASIGTLNTSNVSGNGAGLSSINASNIVGLVSVTGNTLSNINASNLAFGNIQGFYVYGNTLSNISASNIVGFTQVSGNTLSNLNASNLAFGNIQGFYVYGNTLSNISASNISQPFANLVVSNSVTTGNVYASVANVTTLNVNSINNLNPTANYILGTTGTTVTWFPWSNIAGILNFSAPTAITRNLVSFTDFNGSTTLVRSVAGLSNLSFTLATFSPIVSVSPSLSSPNWDQPVSSFTASVTNDSLSTEYINSVASISGSNVGTTLSSYIAGSKSATPAAGVSWTQTFTTDPASNPTSNIYSLTNDNTGGSATGTLTFTTANPITTWGTTASFTVSWKTWSTSISLTGLSGNSFLNPYTTSTYTPSVTNLSGAPTYTISSSYGNLSSTSGSGTLTFTTPVTNANKSTGTITVAVSTQTTRPSTVTGGLPYTSTLTNSSPNIGSSATFNYPTIYYYKIQTAGGVPISPQNSDLVAAGGGAWAGNTPNSNSAVVISSATATNIFGGSTSPITITNPISSPNGATFWFGVRSAYTPQPTSFSLWISNSSSSPLQTTKVLNLAIGNSGQTENYNFYGIVMTNGSSLAIFIS